MQCKIKTCLWFLLVLLWAGCSELEAPVLEPPTLSANAAADLTRFSVTLSGGIKLSGSSTVKEYGLAYSTVSSMAEENTERVRISYDSSQSTYEVKLTGLTPGTSYFYRFYATNGYTEVYSEKLSFTTKADDVPTLDAVTLLSSAESSMEVKSSFIDEGGSTIQQYGFAYKKVGSSSEEKQVKASNKNGSGVFSLVINDLDHSSEYEVRAYAVNSKGTGYSEVLTVSTTVPVTPEVKLTATASSHKMVTLSGSIQNIEQANGITEVGFYWGTESTDLEQKGQHIIAKLEDDYTFKVDLTELTQSTTYYAKAYAINKGITGYSGVVNATTARSVVPVLGALTVVSTTENSVKLKGSITDFGGHDITALAYGYKLEGAEETSGEIALSSLQTDGTFTFTVSGLQHSTAYEIRAFATNEAGQGASEALTVTTATPKAPSLKLTAVADSHQSISLTATVQNPSEANGITEVGFYYSKNPNDVETVGQQVIAKLENNVFKASLTNLEQNTTYYIKAYAVNKGLTGYSDMVNATTLRSVAPVLSALTLVTASEKALVIAGTITDKGGHDITGLGYLYQKPNSAEEIRSEITLDKLNSDGTFQFTIADLQPGSTYQVRAFAVNQAGTGYSAYASLATQAQQAPTLNVVVGTVTANSISLSAFVTDKGSAGAALCEIGFVYSTTNTQPTVQDQKVVMDNVTENFSTVLNNLLAGTTYYIRAYAKNDTQLGYSDVKKVTTTRSAAPTVDKVTISNIAESSVTLTGKVLDTGNNNLTGIGFSYKTADGSEMQVSVSLTALGNDNTFQTVLSGLSANTDYQVRAYATNKEGTGYSSEYASFKTLDFVAPTLTVNSSDVTAESLVLSAVIQSIGKEGATLGEVGFCWSTTNKTPTLSDNVKKVTANGMNFAATLDKLKSETTYYIRAFATNESTVGYSGVITVKTLVSDKPGIDDNPSPEL